jgi:hypothetical protein
MLQDSLQAPPTRSYENRIVIRPMGKSWKDVNWDRAGHRTCVNQELGMFCRLLYPCVVTIDDRRVVALSWSHWGLKLYVDQGTF